MLPRTRDYNSRVTSERVIYKMFFQHSTCVYIYIYIITIDSDGEKYAFELYNTKLTYDVFNYLRINLQECFDYGSKRFIQKKKKKKKNRFNAYGTVC